MGFLTNEPQIGIKQAGFSPPGGPPRRDMPTDGFPQEGGPSGLIHGLGDGFGRG